MDKYWGFRELAGSEPEGISFRVRVLARDGCDTVIVSPHGGGIEPGTSEVAEAIAGEDFSFYALEGLMGEDNGRLHITSTRFDEPRCIALVGQAARVVTVHGEADNAPVVFIGGRDESTGERLRSALANRGFEARTHTDPRLQGRDPANICNRGSTGAGVQLELSDGLRQTFFASLKARGRTTKTDRFAQFVATVREVLA